MGQFGVQTTMEPGEAAAVVQIFEQGAGFTLSSTQRTRAQQIVLTLTPRATVEDFIAAAEQQPDLNDFAAAVRGYFSEGCGSESS
ncbi:hypothetical protein [Sulfurivermis fontis]|uniref:hypothetical protein n=1 Tax=Sulfurivermis fontis TaxID=1972068 RepID=UPI000FD6C4B8|nr:hypothetical protein [Sulfurivermis fontis]